MKRYLPHGLTLFAMTAVGWGVFLVEDGLFNSGIADFKEFAIGLVFLLAGCISVLGLFYSRTFLNSAPPWPGLIVLLLVVLAYAAGVHSRWPGQAPGVAQGRETATLVAHVEATNEWIVIRKSLLLRPARWYESAIELNYLDDDRQRLTVNLPAKYLPLKSIRGM